MWKIKSNEIPCEYGTYPGSKKVKELIENGFLILDKWQGPTSHDVVSSVKKILNLKKAGHSGTLDPGVSGVLPIALENSCKIMPALQNLDKEYVGVMYLHNDVEMKKLQNVLKKFIGEIKQKPPIRSAVKRVERKRNIYSFEILGKKDKNVAFKISCQAGTYIRMVCHKIGLQLKGAHMKELRRIRVGNFTEKNSIKLQDLDESYQNFLKNGDEKIRDYILPIELSVEHLGKIIIKDSCVYSIVNGSPLYCQGISKFQKTIKKNDLVSILTLKGELIAIGKSVLESKEMTGRKMVVKINRVIMKNGIYPKMEF